MPYQTGIRLLCVTQNPANGFPARLLEIHQDADQIRQAAEDGDSITAATAESELRRLEVRRDRTAATVGRDLASAD